MVFRECNVCLKRWPHGSASTCVCEEMTIKEEIDELRAAIEQEPRQWQGLTDEEIEHCCYEADSKAADHPKTWKWTEGFARAIEAKLRERNT